MPAPIALLPSFTSSPNKTHRMSVGRMGASTVLFAAFVICLFFAVPSLEAREIQRTVTESSGLHYLSKFCYSKGSNKLIWHSWIKGGEASHVSVMLFDDESSSWPAVEGSKNCTLIRQRAKLSWTLGNDQKEVITINDHTRPRYWYIALFRCPTYNLENYKIDYRIEFLNGGGWWENQFSFDDQGLMATYLTLALIYLIISAGTLYVIAIKARSGSLNHVLRLFGLVVCLLEIAFWALFIHDAVYADDGIGAPGLKGFAIIIDICATLMFMWVFMLLAKGWMVTTSTLDGKRVLTILFCVFFFTYIALFIWENLGVREEDAYNVYETVPSILNLCVRVVIWAIFFTFIFLTFRSSNNYEVSDGLDDRWTGISGKKSYCIILSIVGTVWFLSLPFIVLVSLGAPLYERYKTTVIAYLAITAVVHALTALWLAMLDNGPVTGGNTLLGGFTFNDKPEPAPVISIRTDKEEEGAAFATPFEPFQEGGKNSSKKSSRRDRIQSVELAGGDNDSIIDSRTPYDTL